MTCSCSDPQIATKILLGLDLTECDMHLTYTVVVVAQAH